MSKLSKKKNINFNLNRSDEFSKLLFDSLKVLGSALPSDLERYLKKRALSKAREIFTDKVEIRNYVKKNVRNRRTIQRKLAYLRRQGFVEKRENGRYYVSEWVSSELRFFSREQANRFGQLVLDNILSLNHPTVAPIKYNIDELIEMFGFSIMFCLLEAVRPVPSFRKPDSEYLSKLFKDKLALAWVKKVFDPEFMLNAFISAMTNQVSERERKQIWKRNMVKMTNDRYRYQNNPHDTFKGPPSASHFLGERLEQMVSKKTKVEYAKKKTKPFFELEKVRISQIAQIMKELYPDYYEMGMKARELFLGRPKEAALQNRFEEFREFED
jgi:DNA-binding transcriptional regulator YhcF (GntR family)